MYSSRELLNYFLCKSSFLMCCLLPVAKGGVFRPLYRALFPCTRRILLRLLPCQNSCSPVLSIQILQCLQGLTRAPEEPSPTSYPRRVVPFLCLLTARWCSTWLHFVSHYYKILFFLILSSSTRLRSLWDKACYILPTYHFRPKMDIPSCTQIRTFCSPLTSKCIMGQIYRLLRYFYSNYLMREEEKKCNNQEKPVQTQ